MGEETKVERATAKTRLRRRLRFLRTRARELKMIGKALVSTKHPVLVHIIPMRQCNLACTYCNEFDDFSKPVPLEVLPWPCPERCALAPIESVGKRPARASATGWPWVWKGRL